MKMPDLDEALKAVAIMLGCFGLVVIIGAFLLGGWLL
jgi:hypothetical protein